jgi:glycine cleavage system H protein
VNPDDIKYHREHAWARVEGKRATIGITDYAQQQMGDIVYIDMPEAETEIDADSELSEVESTKATSPVVSPVSGTVAEINEDLADSPEIINEDPYGNGWLVVLEMSDPSELNDLMSRAEYEKFLKEEEGK